MRFDCEGAGEGELRSALAANRTLPLSPSAPPTTLPLKGGGLANRRPCWSKLSPLSPKPFPAMFGSAPPASITATTGAGSRELAALAARYDVPMLALGDVLYHAPERRRLQDVLSCVREKRTLETAGRLLEANAERHLKSAAEMARLFAEYPQAISETLAVFERLTFSLDEISHDYEYPLESAGESATPFDELVRLTWLGAALALSGRRAGERQQAHRARACDHQGPEIRGLFPHRARHHGVSRASKGILCQGRGSAANSAVCYCLRITDVDPKRGDLLFERFISRERNEPPDIDVDFEHERREEVMQYVYEKYGHEHAGIAATVITYRSRSAAREVGKAFGLSEDAVGALAGNVWGWSNASVDGADARRAGLDPEERRIGAGARDVARDHRLPAPSLAACRRLRHHPQPARRGGADPQVGDGRPQHHRVGQGRPRRAEDPQGRRAGARHADGLKQGFDLLEQHYGEALDLATIPAEEPEVYDMICRADTLGVFQIESRAQMTMLPRLKPRKFYDLVIEVAIVRPGPIQGDMVHPYLQPPAGDREGALSAARTPITGRRTSLKNVLGKTLGVPLFQEQAMRIAIVAAKFEPGEADQLRRAMATFQRVGTIGLFKAKMIEGMVSRGYERSFAERCFSQIEGFGEYGFPESHAASFALLVYASSWIKCHYPDVFCAAMLNAQPMGFYAPAQLVRDAREHGVEMREVDVNFSEWDSTLEEAAHPLPLLRANSPPPWGRG